MEKSFSKQDSLKVIDEMIAQAKYKPGTTDSLITLLWGYLVFIAALLHWFLQTILHHEYAPAAWLLMLVGAAATSMLVARSKRRVKTYIDTLIKQLWIAFGISFALLFFVMQPVHPHFLPTIILLYGIAMWMQGSLIRYKPYKAGALVCWICSGLAFFTSNEEQLLVLAGTVLLSYILPGHLLFYETRKTHV